MSSRRCSGKICTTSGFCVGCAFALRQKARETNTNGQNNITNIRDLSERLYEQNHCLLCLTYGHQCVGFFVFKQKKHVGPAGKKLVLGIASFLTRSDSQKGGNHFFFGSGSVCGVFCVFFGGSLIVG